MRRAWGWGACGEQAHLGDRAQSECIEGMRHVRGQDA